MFESISKCHYCKQSKWRRNFRHVTQEVLSVEVKLVLGVTAITVDRRQDRRGIVEKEVEREPEAIQLAIKQLMVGTDFTGFVIPS